MTSTLERLPRDLLRPRTLAVLMGVYERNYDRLVMLLGDPVCMPVRRHLRLPGRPELHVEVRNRSRYTVDLVLTHRFDDQSIPDLSVRLYHDARLAEALPLKRRRNRPLERLPERWRANILLYKWLEYCIDALREAEPEPA